MSDLARKLPYKINQNFKDFYNFGSQSYYYPTGLKVGCKFRLPKFSFPHLVGIKPLVGLWLYIYNVSHGDDSRDLFMLVLCI